MKLVERQEAKKMFFACIASKTMGPMSIDEMEQYLLYRPDTLIWWKGQKQWVSAPEWREMRDEALRGRSDIYFLDHERHIPRTLEEILQLLTPSMKHLTNIKLWSPTEGHTRSIFESRAICEALGLERRQNVRTALDGSVTITKNNLSFIAEIDTVSSVGIGLHMNQNVDLLPAGDVILSFNRTEIKGVAPVTAKLLYTHKGIVGFKFNLMSAESSHNIITHVRKKEGRTVVTDAA